MTENGQMLYMTGFHCPTTKTLCLVSFFICVLDWSGFSAYTVLFHAMSSCQFPVYLYTILHCTLSCRPRAYPDPSPTNSTPISMFSDMYSDVLFRSITRALPLVYLPPLRFLCRRWNLLVETPFLLSICLA